jgi:hypothetical protein
MKLITRVTAGILLFFGVPISLIAIIGMLNPSASPKDREDLGAALVVLGLPPTALGSWLILQERRRIRQQQHDRLQSTFFKLIQENHGQITALRFAMETGLSGEAAKTYLDERAKEFNADYKVSEEGSISYYFDLGNSGLGRLSA